MGRDHPVQLLHRDRAALTAGRALPSGDGAGVVAIPARLAGADRHCPAAVGAEADAGQQRRPGHDLRRRHLRIARTQQLLHPVPGVLREQPRHLDADDLIVGLVGAVFGAAVELVDADVAGARQYPMDCADPPPSARASVELALVQVLGDRFDSHRSGAVMALDRQAEREPHGVGVERVDLQLLLDLGAALLGIDDAVADRGQRAVPKALTRILLQGAQRMLGVLLRLIFVEQRHDLAHHDVHRVLAQLLGHGHELDARFGELADVELQLEMVAEEPAERVNHNDVERRRLRRARLHHALEFGPTIVCRRCTRLDERLDELITARAAIRLAVAALVGDGDVVLGLARGRDTQVKRRAQRHDGRDRVHAATSRTRSRPRSRLRRGVFTTISTSCPSAVRQRSRRSLEKPVSRPLISAEIFG